VCTLGSKLKVFTQIAFEHNNRTLSAQWSSKTTRCRHNGHAVSERAQGFSTKPDTRNSIMRFQSYSTQFCFNTGIVVQFEAVTKILRH